MLHSASKNISATGIITCMTEILIDFNDLRESNGVAKVKQEGT